jgi:hypothetical protein
MEKHFNRGRGIAEICIQLKLLIINENHAFYPTVEGPNIASYPKEETLQSGGSDKDSLFAGTREKEGLHNATKHTTQWHADWSRDSSQVFVRLQSCLISSAQLERGCHSIR